jgi:2,3-bisphosphoglycerate-dependent phosphoglycerate mutase
LAAVVSPARAADRPPQFVAIAFDNCTELERWQELSDFAAELNKDDARKKWGDEQVLQWRRSFDIAPPGGESLRDTIARTLPYYVQEILPHVLRGERTIVAAHGNSLRALVMVLEKLSPEGILKRELATGVPIIYRLNADATVANKVDLAA